MQNTVRFMIRCTPKDLRAWNALAKSEDLPVGAWIAEQASGRGKRPSTSHTGTLSEAMTERVMVPCSKDQLRQWNEIAADQDHSLSAWLRIQARAAVKEAT